MEVGSKVPQSICCVVKVLVPISAQMVLIYVPVALGNMPADGVKATAGG